MLDAAVARRLKLVGFDVDGVLTDNGIYVGMVGDHPVEFKRFHIQDGLGVRMLRTAGLAVVWLSGRESAATALRARELEVDEVIQDPTARKLPAFEALLGVSFRRSKRCSSGAGSAGRIARSSGTTSRISRCSSASRSRSPWRTAWRR